MQRYAIIDTATNKVINVVEYEIAPSNPPPGFDSGIIAVQNDSVGPDWGWSGAALVPPVVAPSVAPVPQSISDRQFYQQLAVQGVITQDEALATAGGVIPQPLLAIIAAMPADQQFGAKMIVAGATVFERNHPLTLAIGAAYGWTPAQIDALFTAASAL